MKHIMVDLETLDVTAASVIMSAGFVCYDAAEKKIAEKAYFVFNTDDQLAQGRSVSARTLAWWAEQSVQARAVFDEAARGLPLREGLEQVSAFFQRHAGFYIWGNGADFDVAMLADAFHCAGLPLPWKYYEVRCYRTLRAMFPDVLKPDFIDTTPHHALDDAVIQARHLQLLLEEHDRCTSLLSAYMAQRAAAKTPSLSISSPSEAAIAMG